MWFSEVSLSVLVRLRKVCMQVSGKTCHSCFSRKGG